jgi:cell division protease FtsH
MSIIKQAPNQPIIDRNENFDWEFEETLVDRRNKLPNRIRRFIRRFWLPGLLLGIIIAALLDADFMRGLLSILGFVFQIAFAIVYVLIQFIAIFWFLGRPRTYTVMPGAEGVSFKDYRGQPEVLEQAEQIVMLLRGVKAFEGAGGEPLNGLLLEGPPGTGKTWLAQAISTEAGVPFFYVDTASLQGMFMGTGALRVGGMYRKARKAAKEYGAAVIFMDEIDAIGARAGVARAGVMGRIGQAMGGDGSGLLSTMLIEMSGFSLEHGFRARMRTWFYKTFLRRNPPKIPKRVLTIGATNRVQALDAALLRPGRFDKKIRIDAPDMEGRRDIFEYYLSKMAHDDTMEPLILATETPGYTPADIKYVLNETLRYALFAGRRYMTYKDFQTAKPEHEMGLRAPVDYMTKEAVERIAYYQAGKAVAVRLFQPHHRIARITVVRQGFAFGQVSHFSAKEKYQGMMTRDEYLNALRVLCAGRAAEIEFCGAQNQSMSVMANMGSRAGRSDFAQIRRLLQMLGLAGIFGPLGGALSSMENLPPEMAQAMEEAFQKTMQETRKALRENAAIVKALVALLMEKHELTAPEVRAFFDQYGLHTPDPTLVRGGEEISLFEAKQPAELPAPAPAE